MRRAILGSRKILKDEGLTEETEKLRALGAVTAAECLEILDLHITGKTTRRSESDITTIVSMITAGSQVEVRLSDDRQSRLTLLSSKPYVRFEARGQFDESSWQRWKRINTPSSFPTEDLIPTEAELSKLFAV